MNATTWGVIVVFGLLGYWIIGYVFDRTNAQARKRRGGGAARPADPSAPRADDTARAAEAAVAEDADDPAWVRANWHRVLQVAPEASLDEIERGYRALVSQYHPDKVASLGPELRALAERKTTKLNLAYDAARTARR